MRGSIDVDIDVDVRRIPDVEKRAQYRCDLWNEAEGRQNGWGGEWWVWWVSGGGGFVGFVGFVRGK